MELRDVVRRRRMVRAFDPARPVPGATVRRLLEAAVRAPSAGFTQGWDFLVLDRPADVARFWDATTDPAAVPDSWLRGMATAPVLVVCLSRKDAYLDRYAEPDKGWTDRDEARWPVPYWDVDTGMAALLVLLTAVDEGLGACFFGVPGERWDAVRSAFDVPADRRPVGVVALGHPAPDRRSPSLRRGRRPLGDVAHGGRFGTPWSPEDGEGAGTATAPQGPSTRER
ncbi:nitroreductase family protein [Thalassiella azotivora]